MELSSGKKAACSRKSQPIPGTLGRNGCLLGTRQIGEHVFPGASTAEIEFWKSLPVGKTSEDLEKEGILLVGIGGGRFDEHASATTERKSKHCAATLVAAAIGLDEDPALKELLSFTAQRDLTLSGTTFDLSGMIKLMYAAGRNDMTVWQWAFDALEAIYDNAMKFFEGAASDFVNAKVYKVDVGKEKPLTFAVGVSDSRQFAKFARSSYGARAGLVIQQKSAGNVLIQTQGYLKINLRDAAKLIRIEEMKTVGRTPPRDEEAFRAEGKIEGCDEWYFLPAANMLLNESSTHEFPPTKLPLTRIEELVQIGVNPNAFERMRSGQCKRGFCSSTEYNPCSWYDWNLGRCRAVRQKEQAIKAANRRRADNFQYSECGASY